MGCNQLWEKNVLEWCRKILLCTYRIVYECVRRMYFFKGMSTRSVKFAAPAQSIGRHKID